MPEPSTLRFSPKTRLLPDWIQYAAAWILCGLLAPAIASAGPEDQADENEGTRSKPGPGIQVLDHTVHFGIRSTVQLDIIHDFNATGLEVTDPVAREFITAVIPVSGNPAAQNTNRTVFSPNQSDLILWASSETRWGEAKAFVDFNMTKSAVETQFHVYKAWAKLGYLKFGLDYSLFMNQRAIPKTLDFEGPQVLPEPVYAQASLQIPIARIGHGEKKNLFVGLGLEESKAQVTVEPVYKATADDQVPALFGNITYNTDDANLTLIGVYRRLRASGEAYDSSANGWGLYLSGNIQTWGRDSLMGGVLGGRGIAALVDDTFGLKLDAVSVSGPDNPLKAVGLIGFWGAYEHFWNPQLSSVATFGFLKVYSDFIDRELGPQSADGDYVGIYNETVYASANLLWTPFSFFSVGAEYLYGYQRIATGSSDFNSNKGHDHRLQITFRINFEYAR